MHEIEQPRLDQLRLRQWRDHPQHRFVGKEYGAFRHGIDITGEAQPREVVEEPVREPIVLPEPPDLFPRELQILKKIDGLLESRRHKEASASRKPTHKELEYGGVRLAMIQVGLKHVELIQISQQRACRRIHMANPM